MMLRWDPDGMHRRDTIPTALAFMRLLRQWLTRYTVRLRGSSKAEGRVRDEIVKGISCPADHIGKVVLVGRLRDLLSQWRETTMLYNTAPLLRDVADGYAECIAELEAVLNDDLGPIERIRR